MSAEVEVVMPP